MQLNSSMVKAYQSRWQSVGEIEAEEQKKTSFTLRWQKLNALLRMAAGLGVLQADGDTQVEIVRQRWNFLRNLYLLDHQEGK